MPLRLVLAALSALLTPPGVPGEVGVEVDLLLEEDHPRAQQPALAAGPGPDLARDLRSVVAPLGSGTAGCPAPVAVPTLGLLAGAGARAGFSANRHLARCGHDASALDLPPPPRT